MTIDYKLVVSELKKDLKRLANEDAEFRKNICQGAQTNKLLVSSMTVQHLTYVSALNDALKATSEKYHTEYEPIPPIFGE